jgi:peptidoglycan/LPS O-acetylase OafA/YrhL
MRSLWKNGLSPLQDLLPRPTGQMAALDVLRTFAVLLVIAGHAAAEFVKQGGGKSSFTQFPLVSHGWIGVDLFFVLSGYLIGKQLWVELLETRTIRFGRFIVRRGLRIWPLYFFFMVFVITVLGRGSFPFGSWWSDAVFLTNYINQGVVMGSWSLCTEEQFYILSPLLLLAGSSITVSMSAYRRFLWAMFLFQPVTRMITWLAAGGTLEAQNPALFRQYVYYPIHTHADGLILGLIIANYQASGVRFRDYRIASSWWAIVAAIGFCLLTRVAHSAIFFFTGITVLFGTSVWLVIARPSISTFSFVRWRVFYLGSRLSFGMYLNHEYLQEEVALVVRHTLPFLSELAGLQASITFGVLVVLSASFAVLTFCLVEHPFLRLRSRCLSSERGRKADKSPNNNVVHVGHDGLQLSCPVTKNM